MQAMCRDISATGMSLEVDEPAIEVGTQISVAIESSSSQIPSLAAIANVVRCEPETDASCIIGVEITQMK
jgi:hypothetical protein